MKHLDLFTGIGGFKLAAEWSGFETIGFAEVAEYPSAELARLWPDIPNFGDVSLICPDEQEACDKQATYISASDIVGKHGDIDLLTAGVPCQPASHAGLQLGSADERWLWPHVLRILGVLRPPFAIFENPPGIKTVENGHAFKHIQNQLAQFGYDYWWETVPATAVGAGHVRKRVFLIAYSHSARLERYPEHVIPEKGWAESRRPSPSAYIPSRKTSNGETWYHESPVPIVVDGISPHSLKAEFTAIGNSIVPQVAYCFIQPIADLIQFNKEHDNDNSTKEG